MAFRKFLNSKTLDPKVTFSSFSPFMVDKKASYSFIAIMSINIHGNFTDDSKPPVLRGTDCTGTGVVLFLQFMVLLLPTMKSMNTTKQS